MVGGAATMNIVAVGGGNTGNPLAIAEPNSKGPGPGIIGPVTVTGMVTVHTTGFAVGFVNDPETSPGPPGPTVQVAPEPTTTDGAPKENPGNTKGTENDPVVVPGAIEITSVVSTLLPTGMGRL
jgi:hypothetical protein